MIKATQKEIREATSEAVLAGLRSDEKIDGWRIRLYFLSRSPKVLLWFVICILVIAGGVALHFDKTSNQSELNVEEGGRPETLNTELQKPKPNCDKTVQYLIRDAHFADSKNKILVQDQISASHLPAEIKPVFIAFWNSLITHTRDANAELTWLAHQATPPCYANELVGDFHFARRDAKKAQRYYDQELLFHDSEETRRKQVESLFIQKNYKALLQLDNNPKYSKAFTPVIELMLGMRTGGWKLIYRSLKDLESETCGAIPVMLTLAAGLVWMTISLQAIQPKKWICFETIAPFFALLAGMASTWPTLFAVVWEEENWNLRLTGKFVGDLSFFILGVGVREEMIKLLFFIPFVPILLWRGRRLEMLIIASCVGLGFALEENLQYYHQHGSAVAFGRFLTANFFHLAATGLIGLSFCEALMQPIKKGWVFPVTAAMVILIHGLYDSFMAIAVLQPLSMVSMISFLLISQFYFRKLGTHRDSATDQLSIGATLVCGMAMLTGLIFVCATIEMGFSMALGNLALTGFSLMMIAYMFHWQLGEGMSEMAASKTLIQ